MYEDDDIDQPRRRSIFGLFRAKVDTALQERHDELAVRRAQSAAKVNEAKAKVSKTHAGSSDAKVDSIAGKAEVYVAQRGYEQLTGQLPAGLPPGSHPAQQRIAAAQPVPQIAAQPKRIAVIEGLKVDLNALTERDVETIAVRIARYLSDNMDRWNRELKAQAVKDAFRGRATMTSEEIEDTFRRRVDAEMERKFGPLELHLDPESVQDIKALVGKAWRGLDSGLIKADRDGRVTQGRLRDVA